jgi:hypothetical protein
VACLPTWTGAQPTQIMVVKENNNNKKRKETPLQKPNQYQETIKNIVKVQQKTFTNIFFN